MTRTFAGHAAAVCLLLLCGCRTVVDSDARVQPEVVATLRAGGEVAVMIALVAPPADAAGAAQRSEIARMQAEVRAALDTADFRHTQSFAAIPAMSGVIRTERGLQQLLAHPLVRRVDPDVGGTGSGSTTRD